MNATMYETTARSLVERIVRLIPANPQIMQMKSAWDLFGVSGFDCADLQPSLFQASWALAKAKDVYRPTCGIGCHVPTTSAAMPRRSGAAGGCAERCRRISVGSLHLRGGVYG